MKLSFSPSATTKFTNKIVDTGCFYIKTLYINHMRKYKNTLQKGSVRYIVFKENDVWYAAGLEFNVVESAIRPKRRFCFYLKLFPAMLNRPKK